MVAWALQEAKQGALLNSTQVMGVSLKVEPAKEAKENSPQGDGGGSMSAMQLHQLQQLQVRATVTPCSV